MKKQKEIASTLKMVADYMDGGFLENIVAMFKQDNRYYPLIGTLLGDERSRVRIGTAALVETLKEDANDDLLLAIPGIAELLEDNNATIRGDAAYLLGIIGHHDALPFLAKARNDDHHLVRETIEEAIMEIQGSSRLF